MKNPIDIYFEITKKAQFAGNEAMEPTIAITPQDHATEILNHYVAFLRAIYIIYQNAHWKCKSPHFYCNHLMFQRLYEMSQDQADAAAEKLIGLHGDQALDLVKQNQIIAEVCGKFIQTDPVTNCLAATEEFLRVNKETYKSLKDNDEISLGLDDLIMGQASEFETAIYLLKQSS